jgi:hypothetical protein
MFLSLPTLEQLQRVVLSSVAIGAEKIGISYCKHSAFQGIYYTRVTLIANFCDVHKLHIAQQCSNCDRALSFSHQASR